MCKQSGILFIVCLFVSSVALSAQSTKRTTSSGEMVETAFTPRTKSAQVSVGPVVAVFPDDGETGFGSQIGVGARMAQSVPLYVGIDLALHFWGKFRAVAGDNTTGLQLLPTAYYQYDVSTVVHPYAGVSAGPYIMTGGTPNVGFGLLFRPGFNFTFSDVVGLNVEMKFGEVVNNFIWTPNLSLLLSL